MPTAVVFLYSRLQAIFQVTKSEASIHPESIFRECGHHCELISQEEQP